MIALLLIALSLSMDAFAVSVGCGVNIREQRFFHALRASFCFGLFQAVMPLLGWFLGSAFTARVEAYSGWIAFAILSFIGGKMIVEALRGWKKPPAETSSTDVSIDASTDIRNTKTLLALSFATSIDALAAGVGLNIMGLNVWLCAIVIGGVTFLVCLCGFEFGRRAGAVLGRWAVLAGGLVLIGIGAGILLM